jgi:hypothetical protein
MDLHFFFTKCSVMSFHLHAGITSLESFNGIGSNLICGSEMFNIANICYGI